MKPDAPPGKGWVSTHPVQHGALSEMSLICDNERPPPLAGKDRQGLMQRCIAESVHLAKGHVYQALPGLVISAAQTLARGHQRGLGAR